jgi:inorganic triphosphatase YgiF
MTTVHVDNRRAIKPGPAGRHCKWAKANSEVEFKFDVERDAAEWLIHSHAWPEFSSSRPQRQISIYYDTPDFELRKHGYSLRVRCAASRFTQTLKALNRSAGLFERDEWEEETEGKNPDMSHLAKTPAGRLKLERLRPVIQMQIDRTSCRIAEECSEVAVDVDIGTICASASILPVSEVEIELIKGQPSAALDVARRIADEIPIKLAVMSKAERGFALQDAELPSWKRLGTFRPTSKMSIRDGLSIMIADCLRRFRLNEPLVAEERDADALHSTRVAMRDLRSALWLFQPALIGWELTRIQDELRWFFAETGDARNIDVYLERDFQADQRQYLTERREDAYDRCISMMDSARFRKLMLDVLAWSVAGKWRERPVARRPIAGFVNPRIDRLCSKILGVGAVKQMGDRSRHRLRIRVKKLRCALAFVDDVKWNPPRRKKSFEKRLKQLQESLGGLHDIVVARSLARLSPWLGRTGGSRKAERRLARRANRSIARLRKLASCRESLAT